MTVRQSTPEDYPAISAIGNLCYPEYPGTPEEIRHRDEHRDPQCHHRRYLLEEGGEVVAVAEYGHAQGEFHPRKFWIELMVRPELQGRGIGRMLYGRLMEEMGQFEPISLRTGAREDMARGVRFLKDRGFEERMRSWESRLFVGDFDSASWQGAEERPRAHGIEIRTLTELRDTPDCARRLWELEWHVMQDVPHSEPLTQTPFEVWEKQHFESPTLLPDGYFIAVHGDCWVGLSQLWSSPADPKEVYTGLTGVRREYRRKGIALAMKLRAVRYAQDRGHDVIKTWNEQNNRAMLSINEALGYVKQPAWIEFVRHLRPEEE